MLTSGTSFKKVFFSILLLVIATLLFLRHQQIEQSQTLRWFDRSVLFVTTPVARAVRATRDGVSGVFHRYFYLIGTEAENRALKEKLDRYKIRQIYFEETVRENRRLQEALSLQSELKGHWVGARVLIYSPLSPYRIVTIDKGSKDGITRRAPVVSPAGLVGQVSRVFPYSSEVLLMTDPTSAVDGRLESSQARGLVVGKHVKLGWKRDVYISAVEYLNQATQIQNGDRVLTSGMDGVYPPGISIGTVSLKEKSPYDIFQEADVIPAVDFNTLREVLVLSP